MQGFLHPKRIGIPFAALAAIALVIAGAAYALTSKSFTYSKAKTGYVIVSHMAFTPGNDTRIYTTEPDTGLTTTGVASTPAGSSSGRKGEVDSDLLQERHGQRDRTALADGAEQRKRVESGDRSAGRHVRRIPLVHRCGVRREAGREPRVQLRHPGLRGPGDTFYGAKVKYTYTSAGS